MHRWKKLQLQKKLLKEYNEDENIENKNMENQTTLVREITKAIKKTKLKPIETSKLLS